MKFSPSRTSYDFSHKKCLISLLSLFLGLFSFLQADNNHFADPKPPTDPPPCNEPPKAGTCPDSKDPQSGDPCPENTAGDPIMLNTGEFYINERFLDQIRGGLEIRMYLNFHYRTYLDSNTPSGYGWIHNYNQRLRENNKGGLTMINYQGAEIQFESDGTGEYRSLDERDLVARLDMTLQRYIVTQRSGLEMHFHLSGYVTKVIETDGSFLELSYEGSDAEPLIPEKKVVIGLPRHSNMEIPTTLVRDFRVQTVQEYLPSGTATGRSYTFAYDANTGLLDLVTDQQGRSITLLHESVNYTDPQDSSVQVTTNSNLLSFLDGDGNETEFTYTAINVPAVSAADVGYMKTFTRIGCSECTLRTNTYHSDGKVSKQEQGSNGLLGEKIEITYQDNADSVVTQTTLKTTTRTYSPQSNEFFDEKVRTEVISYQSDVYGNAGLTSRATSGETGAKTYGYYDQATDFDLSSKKGRKNKVKFARALNGLETTYDYKPSGNRSQVKKMVSAGVYHITDYEYTDGGEGRDMTSETMYLSDNPTEKFITEYEYNAEGLRSAVKRKKADGSYVTEEYEYYTSGEHKNLLYKTISYNGSESHTQVYEYTGSAEAPQPFGMVKRQYDLENPTLQTLYVYDSVGRVISQTDARGFISNSTYDQRGKLLTRTLLDTDGVTVLHELVNTREKNYLLETKMGNSTEGYRYVRYHYDLFGSRYKTEQVTVDPVTEDEEGFTVSEVLIRDTEGRSYMEEDASGLTTNKEYDILNRLTEQYVAHESADGTVSNSTTTLHYEGSDTNYEMMTSPLGISTFIERDDLERIVRRYENYDPATETAERITEYDYNALGDVIEMRILDSSETLMATSRYYYDRLGRIVGVNWDPANTTPDTHTSREFPAKVTYDDVGNILTQTDAKGNTTSYSYDNHYRLEQVTPADSDDYTGGNTMHYVYDDLGQLIRSEDGRGIYRYFHYDARGRLAHTSVETTDDWLASSWWQDSIKVEVENTFNTWGNTLSVTNLSGAKRVIQYDSFGRVVSQTTNDTLRVQNNFANLLQVSSVDYLEVNPTDNTIIPQGTTTYTYSENNPIQLLSYEDSEGNKSGYVYDLGFQLLKTVNYLNHPSSGTDFSSSVGSEYSYDALGRLASMTTTAGELSWYEYDIFNQAVTTYLPSHFENGRTTPDIGDLAGQQLRTFNNYGQVTSITGAQTYAIEYSYDTVGNMVTMTDNKEQGGGSLFNGGTVTKWSYDERNRVVRKDYNYQASGNTSENHILYSYDKNGQLSSYRDGEGQVAQYAYLAGQNKLASIDYPSDQDVSFSYSPTTRQLTTVQRLSDITAPSSASTETSYSYDNYGRLDIHNQHGTGWLIDYDLDYAGRRTAKKLRMIGSTSGSAEEQTTSLAYDTLSRITSVQSDQLSADAFSISYPDRLNPVKTTRTPHGQSQRMVYDPATERQIASEYYLADPLNLSGQGDLLSSYAYDEFTSLGQRKGITLSGSAFTSRYADAATRPADIDIAYNAAGEVASTATESSASTLLSDLARAYEYDALGNRETAQQGSTSLTYQPNKLNQYTNILSNSRSHDDNGSLLSDGDKTYSWNDQNRLISVTTASQRVEFSYNIQGQRIERREYASPSTTTVSKTTNYLIDSWNVVAEFENGSSTPTRTMLWGSDLSGAEQGAGGVGGLLAITDHGSTIQHYYPAYDGNGNITDYVDSLNQHVAHSEYDAFGGLTHQWQADPAVELNYGFNTKPKDEVSGLHYYGYRYYDSVTGRWPSRDPMQEEGGVNIYNFINNNGINQIDVLGLISMGDAITGGLTAAATAVGVYAAASAPSSFGAANAMLAADQARAARGLALAAANGALYAVGTEKYCEYKEKQGQEDKADELGLPRRYLPDVSRSPGQYAAVAGNGAAFGVIGHGAFSALGQGFRSLANNLRGRMAPNKGLGNQNSLFKSALQPFKKTKFTEGGRAVTKHPEYFGFDDLASLQKVYNTPQKLNALAADSLKSIIRNGKVTTGAGGRYPNGWKTITSPDGRAASWNVDGTFIGFRGIQ